MSQKLNTAITVVGIDIGNRLFPRRRSPISAVRSRFGITSLARTSMVGEMSRVLAKAGASTVHPCRA